MIDDQRVEVVAAELSIAMRRKDLENALLHFEDREIEGSAAEVVDRDPRAFAEFVEPIGQRGGSWLVENAQDLEPGQFAGAFGVGALGIVEICGHGDHCLGDGRFHAPLGDALEFFENFRADLHRRFAKHQGFVAGASFNRVGE